MSSRRRILASRANGAKSLGPKTTEGKCRASQNALRHGMAAETLVLTNESRSRFEALLAAYIERFQPRDEVEADLIEEIVAANGASAACGASKPRPSICRWIVRRR